MNSVHNSREVLYINMYRENIYVEWYILTMHLNTVNGDICIFVLIYTMCLNTVYTWRVDAWTKWSTVCRRCFELHFVEKNLSRDRLIFKMGIPIPGKDGLYSEMGPRTSSLLLVLLCGQIASEGTLVYRCSVIHWERFDVFISVHQHLTKQ